MSKDKPKSQYENENIKCNNLLEKIKRSTLDQISNDEIEYFLKEGTKRFIEGQSGYKQEIIQMIANERNFRETKNNEIRTRKRDLIALIVSVVTVILTIIGLLK